MIFGYLGYYCCTAKGKTKTGPENTTSRTLKHRKLYGRVAEYNLGRSGARAVTFHYLVIFYIDAISGGVAYFETSSFCHVRDQPCSRRFTVCAGDSNNWNGPLVVV